VLGVLVIARTTLATPGTGITSANLSVGRLGEIHTQTETNTHGVELRTTGLSDVYVVSNKIAPGGHTGWHSHAGPSVITVKSGTVTNYGAHGRNCAGQVYSAGMSFVDPGGGHVHILRNEGSVEAETIAFQILPAGSERRIDAPDPGHCGHR